MKKKDIERLVEKDGQLWSTFKESVSDSKFSDFLTKVFKKKMKRSKRKASDGQGLSSVLLYSFDHREMMNLRHSIFLYSSFSCICSDGFYIGSLNPPLISFYYYCYNLQCSSSSWGNYYYQQYQYYQYSSHTRQFKNSEAINVIMKR